LLLQVNAELMDPALSEAAAIALDAALDPYEFAARARQYAPDESQAEEDDDGEEGGYDYEDDFDEDDEGAGDAEPEKPTAADAADAADVADAESPGRVGAALAEGTPTPAETVASNPSEGPGTAATAPPGE
jgi:hypothetical protein